METHHCWIYKPRYITSPVATRRRRIPLHLYTQVFGHGGGEILWFTKLHAWPQDQQRTGSSGHPCRLYLPIYLWRFWTCSLFLLLLVRPDPLPKRAPARFCDLPMPMQSRDLELKTVWEKEFFLLKQHMYFENKHKEQSLPIQTRMVDRF